MTASIAEPSPHRYAHRMPYHGMACIQISIAKLFIVTKNPWNCIPCNLIHVEASQWMTPFVREACAAAVNLIFCVRERNRGGMRTATEPSIPTRCSVSHFTSCINILMSSSLTRCCRRRPMKFNEADVCVSAYFGWMAFPLATMLHQHLHRAARCNADDRN